LHPYPPEYEDQIPVLPGGISQGGSETSAFKYALKLAEAGHRVTYYVGRYPGISKSEIRIGSNFRMVYVRTFFKNVGPAFSIKLFFSLLFGGYDVVQSHQIPTMFTLIGAVASRIRRIPCIITFHGRLPYNFIDGSVGMLASILSTCVTVQNQYAYELVSSFVPRRRLRIVPHGIDTDLFHKQKVGKDVIEKYNPEGDKVVLFVGRLIPAKGVDVLIAAFSSLLCEVGAVRLLIAGNGPHRAEYEHLARTSGHGERIRFLGAVPQSELPRLYSLADVFVLPSTYHYADGRVIRKVSENFGLVIAEAMSCEVPVVASRVGGIPLWVEDGRTAVLVEERRVDDLKNALHSLLFDQAGGREVMIRNAKGLVMARYSWEAVIAQFEPLFQLNASS
jgi:glycosyltransferase involved in cell wall biosynthesis